MNRNFVSTIKMMSFYVAKTFAAIFAMGLVFVAMTFYLGEDMTYSSTLLGIMVTAGMSALFFTEAGVYQSICLSFGCTRKVYFTAMQTVKVILAAMLCSVTSVLGFFVFKTVNNVTIWMVITDILSYLAMFSGTELFGYLTVKIGRWGLAILTIVISLGAGVISGLSIAAPDLLPKILTNNYLLMSVLLVLSIVFSFCTYLFVRKYSVRG